MKNTFTLLATLFLFGLVGNAQEWAEDFNGTADGNLPAGWAATQVSGGGVPAVQSNIIACYNTLGVLDYAENWLFTPQFVPQGGNALLTFDLGITSGLALLGGCEFFVKISTGAQTTTGGYTTLVSAGESNLLGLLAGSEGTITVSIPESYWGQDCYVAFQMNCSGTLSDFNWGIDNVSFDSFSWIAGSGHPLFSGSNTIVTIPDGTTTTLTEDLEVHDLIIEPGATLVPGANELRLTGDLVNNGEVDLSATSLVFEGESKQHITGVDTVLNIAYDGGDSLSFSDEVYLTGVLTASSGVVQTNDMLTLVSTALGDASLGDMSFSELVGDVTVERYMPPGNRDWRMIGAPVQNVTFEDMMDDVYLVGIPDSHFPNYYTSGVRYYDETVIGGVQDGFLPVGSAKDTLQQGVGYYIFPFDTTGGDYEFTIDLTGKPFMGEVAVPVTSTASGVTANDGWNLITNPYVSPVDFGALTRGNVDNIYYVYDPESGTTQSWNEASQLGTLGGMDGNLANFQAFWVKANSETGMVTFEEGDKVTDALPFFMSSPRYYLSFQIKHNQVKYFDVLGLLQENLSEYERDEFDSPKFISSHQDAPVMYMKSGGYNLAVNSVPEVKAGDEYDLYILPKKSGVHEFSPYQWQAIPEGVHFSLLNRETGEKVGLSPSTTVELQLTANVAYENYALVVEAMPNFLGLDPTCPGEKSQFTLRGHGDAPWDFEVTDLEGNVLEMFEGADYPILVNGLESGDYLVKVKSEYLPDFIDTISVKAVADAIVLDAVGDVLCGGESTGAIHVQVSGGDLPYSFRWNNGEEGADIFNLAAGSYSVEIVDGRGCNLGVHEYEVLENEIVTVQSDVSSVACFGDSDGAIGVLANGGVEPYIYSWNNGQGGRLNEGLTAGSYTLTVSDAVGCNVDFDFKVEQPDELDLSVNQLGGEIAVSTQVDFEASSSDSVSNLQWFVNNVPVGTGTSLNYTFNESGFYAVTLVGEKNDCQVERVVEFTVSEANSVAEVTTESVVVSREGDKLKVTVSESADSFSAGLRDVLGRELFVSNSNNEELFLPVPPVVGTYLLSIKIGDKVLVKKIQIQ